MLLKNAFLAVIAFLIGAAVPANAQDIAAQEVSIDQANPTGGASRAYRINAGDELAISVWGEERLQRQVKVLPDGTFSFPLVGRVVAQGYLPSEIEGLITEGLRDQYRGQVPQVTVSVAATSGMQFSVVGRVNSPGTFSPGRYINILEALSMAGGPAEFANLDSILIVRKVGDQLTPIRLRLRAVFERGADSNDLARANIIEIASGDTVIVP